MYYTFHTISGDYFNLFLLEPTNVTKLAENFDEVIKVVDSNGETVFEKEKRVYN